MFKIFKAFIALFDLIVSGIGSKIAGYRAVQDDEKAGKPISYREAYNKGKEDYFRNRYSKH